MEGRVKQRDREFKLGEDMIDLREPRFVEVERQGDRLYIHVDGVTVLRIYGAKKVEFRGEEPK